MRFRLIQNASAGIGREPEERVVVLAPDFDAGCARCACFFCTCKTERASEVVGAGVVIQNEGTVIRPADVLRDC